MQVLLEKESEKAALLETLLQTQGELREAWQQLEQLRQEVKEQQENGQVNRTSRAGGKNRQLAIGRKLRERLRAPGNRAKGSRKAIEPKSCG